MIELTWRDKESIAFEMERRKEFPPEFQRSHLFGATEMRESVPHSNVARLQRAICSAFALLVLLVVVVFSNLSNLQAVAAGRSGKFVWCVRATAGDRAREIPMSGDGGTVFQDVARRNG